MASTTRLPFCLKWALTMVKTLCFHSGQFGKASSRLNRGGCPRAFVSTRGGWLFVNGVAAAAVAAVAAACCAAAERLRACVRSNLCLCRSRQNCTNCCWSWPNCVCCSAISCCCCCNCCATVLSCCCNCSNLICFFFRES